MSGEVGFRFKGDPQGCDSNQSWGTKKMTKSNFRSFGMLVVAAMALLLLPVAANAEYLDFWVNESAVPGVPDDQGFVADAFNGVYSEILTFDGLGGFSATLIAQWRGYDFNEGLDPVPAPVYLAGSALIPEQYGMYTVYTATGNITDLGGGEFRFTTTTGAAEIWVDPNSDTGLGMAALPATGGLYPSLSINTDDELVLSASDIYFEDNTMRPGVGGFFDSRFFEPTIEAFGQEYWPTLFGINFLAATVDGDFNEFDPTAAQNITTGGDLSANFTVVPEPSTLVLFGLGLIGTAVAIRRKR